MAKDVTRGLDWPGKDGSPVPRTNHLLVIGVDAYAHHTRLNNARRDAEAFRDLMISRYQFEPEHVYGMFDADATRRNIIAAFEALERRLTEQDNLLIYFSGHGTMNRRKSQGFWVPVDAKRDGTADYLANTRVRDILADMQVHHLYLIVDACFAGSMILRQSETPHIDLSEASPSRRVLSSGRQEVVSDGRPGEHSPFFICLQHQLSQPLPAPLTAKSLELYVSQNTPRNAEQQPVAEFIYGIGDQSGQFVFHPKRHQTNEDEIAWEEAKRVNTIPSYSDYRASFPKGKYSIQARTEIERLEYAKEAWYEAKQENRISSYNHFIDANPTSIYRLEAERRRDELVELYRTSVETSELSRKPDFALPAMIPIEGGTFQLGSNEDDDEKPIHDVTLDSFEIGKYPVTQREWQAIMGENPSHFKGEDRPVESVSWDDCQVFIQKLNQKTGLTFRLPTEAEWEYAAGGGNLDRLKWAGTDAESELGDYAWYSKNSNSETHPVGQKKSNLLGLYDLSGNVFEWCQDWYGDYPSEPQTNPTGPSDGSHRVSRGGSWFSGADYCRVSSRFGDTPGSRNLILGFRLARSLDF